MIALLMLAGCWKQSGEAVVVGKDYIPAIEINEMPNESPLPETTPEGSTPANTPDTDEEEDYAYVDPMGPPMDPRALKHEQWIVRVQMVVDRRQMDVRLEPARWETLKQGDRVHVTYHQGRYNRYSLEYSDQIGTLSHVPQPAPILRVARVFNLQDLRLRKLETCSTLRSDSAEP